MKDKIMTFLDFLTLWAKTYFILATDRKTFAIIKEKSIDVESPVNVLHVGNENGTITGDYEEKILDEIGIEKFYSVKRASKGKYSVHPCLAGLYYHWQERIEAKKTSIRKSIKDKAKADARIVKEISCDLANMKKHICKDLRNMIVKDFPSVKLTAKNSLVNFITIENVEKGNIAFHVPAGKGN